MSAYPALLRRPGAWRAVTASGTAWWAFSGYGLALVLAVQHATGSFAVAGGATAAFATGSAVFAPLRGRTVDRAGRPALLTFVAIHTVIFGLVVAACWQGKPPTWLLVVLTGLAGASAPPLSATARLAWAHVAGPDLARTAQALNATLGDAAAIASPVVTSLIASAASPVLALGVLLPGSGVAALALRGLTPRSAPSRRERAQRSVVCSSRGLRWLMAGDVTTGIWLGALEVAAVAVSLDAGARGLAGVPLVALAVGGIGASLWAGTSHGAAPASTRYVLGMVIAAIALPLTLARPGVTGLAMAAAAAGIGYGLINVALLELIDDVAEASQAIEAFTWITTAQATGLALGAASAGALADGHPSRALYVVAAAPIVGAVAAAAGKSSFSPRSGSTPSLPPRS